jgi:cytoskeletal protein RodZ
MNQSSRVANIIIGGLAVAVVVGFVMEFRRNQALSEMDKYVPPVQNQTESTPASSKQGIPDDTDVNEKISDSEMIEGTAGDDNTINTTPSWYTEDENNFNENESTSYIDSILSNAMQVGEDLFSD